jgi:hypothetical protein
MLNSDKQHGLSALYLHVNINEVKARRSLKKKRGQNASKEPVE